MSCEHARVGNALVKGLSGGKRKRLCIAEALLRQTAMLVLYEPTSCLDSSSAVEVVQLLRRLAKASKILVICNIHQPSQPIFGLFDDVLVLAGGQTSCAGPVKEAGRHMQSLDVPAMEDGSSLPEYLLDLTNSDFTDEQQVQNIWNNWIALEQTIVSAEAAAPMREAKMRGLVGKTLILCRRLAIMAMRGPTVYSARWVFAATAKVVFSLIYIDARDRNQEQALPRIWVMSCCLGAPVFMSYVVSPVYYQDFLVYKKEIGNGMYKPAAYVLSQTIVMIPSILAFSLFVLLPPFLVVGYNWESFLQMMICHAVCGNVVRGLRSAFVGLLPAFSASYGSLHRRRVCRLLAGRHGDQHRQHRLGLAMGGLHQPVDVQTPASQASGTTGSSAHRPQLPASAARATQCWRASAR
ncbi:unnamed protein product [Polarella glacialis]|uniref:ABC-2 type transporter transmembrane domain-containing protein n=1 Tax=Polarella glacialis TaxID=89957 RepID=A0A813EK45_POLGL|nr:unnamed protein product [Polarella glacialis]CAE8683632.1 unnamed protein product [Polarella glacialis]